MNKNQIISLVVVFTILAIISILGTIFAFTADKSKLNIPFMDFGPPHDDVLRFQMTQALQVCQSEIAKDKLIVNSSFDNHSSRYDKPRNSYLLFYKVRRKDDGNINSFHLICRVSASNNRIQEFSSVSGTFE